ncbi:unnamed protein product [Thelazia callipaeda]|uniref:PINc domain-containing protein n=1 Tax=Thelazia callipaeda TaxID=103827 RepID=A0A158RC14_THECL|nr:unnamed protein product [Thelazia callipaeda]
MFIGCSSLYRDKKVMAVLTFNVFRNQWHKNVLPQWLRLNSVFKVHDKMNAKGYLVDTRGSSFSPKAAAVIVLLFGGVHMSLLRSLDENQKSSAKCAIIDSKKTKKYPDPIEQVSKVREGSGGYVDQILKQTSLISLIDSATKKVQLASSDYKNQLFQEFLHALSLEIASRQRDEQKSVTLDRLVRNADARLEINKIIDVIHIARQEAEIRNHPLLIIAESTAHYLMRQMRDIETEKFFDCNRSKEIVASFY